MPEDEVISPPPETPHHGVAPHQCGFCCTTVDRIGVKIGGHSILKDITLHLHCGELTVLIGPNGAGKSMLLRALLGEVKHTGSIHIHPVPQSRHPDAMIGYVPQQLDFDRHLPMSVLDLFAAGTGRFPTFFGATKRLRAAALEALEQVKAAHLLHRRVGALSGGELQRVLLALSLTPAPNLLLLDEPVSGVDAKGRDLFYQIVSDLRRRFDLAILMVSHDLAPAAAVADRMIFLRHSIVTAGKPADVLAHPEVRSTFALDVFNTTQAAL
jgi:zinc transport system ATP-binding protein